MVRSCVGHRLGPWKAAHLGAAPWGRRDAEHPCVVVHLDPQEAVDRRDAEHPGLAWPGLPR